MPSLTQEQTTPCKEEASSVQQVWPFRWIGSLLACLIQDGVSTLQTARWGHQSSGTFLKPGLNSGGHGSVGGILKDYV